MQTTLPAKSIDKRQVAQSIRILMEYADIGWEELKEISPSSARTMKKGDIPEAWKRARGMLKGMDIDPLAYQRAIRAEWDHRP
ncbi:hypothetical protein A3J36_00670 [Candidatus Uhrbacteria bacterium RIFCSPLOWO2_02_FULL_54_37]|uniref:Uncharacterized protein n=2 Tax=Candidatus Uhriibacteriota TaxID=1752732 RepID=A0A1F7VIX4_9BACT|nr:MAG: hypothetical protein A3B36_00930 [Candidatus Uhrbacteria bacterium RIFCSPLOWO2_01_FULL_55_36]OGL89924.1 MAG: hypothetical protein A3J36_00670 [Candidatus Uhrbacteria bacterium RIFCSPLOWO2_02_FULL_54_37]